MITEEEIREMIRKQLGAQGRATRFEQVVALRESLENWIVNCWNEMKAERDNLKKWFESWVNDDCTCPKTCYPCISREILNGE